MYYFLEKRVSHRKWRAFVKAERRRKKRMELACLRDDQNEEELAILMSDPSYEALIREEELLAEKALRMEEFYAQKRREEWMARDLALHKAWLENEEKKKKLLVEKQLKEEQIVREWEETVRKEEEERERKREEQETLLRESTKSLGEGLNEDRIHNPEPPLGYARFYNEEKVEPCPFFLKTGACRFGLYCSRDHEYPSSSRTILLANMYSHFSLDGDATDDYDMDLSLEYTESDRYNHFSDFYFDVLPEFEKCGRVTQFKVCCNKSPHLKGNVYVQYQKVEAAEIAVGMFNGRWYAGKQISCIFVPVERWKPAICGLYWSQKCPKGNNCNFLHVYRNPGNAFYKADRDCYDIDKNSGVTNDVERRSRRSDRSSRSTRRRVRNSSSRRTKSRTRKDERNRSRSRNRSYKDRYGRSKSRKRTKAKRSCRERSSPRRRNNTHRSPKK